MSWYFLSPPLLRKRYSFEEKKIAGSLRSRLSGAFCADNKTYYTLCVNE